MTDLQRATTPELLDELEARFGDMVFAGFRAERDEDGADTFLSIRGRVTVTLGLVARMARMARREEAKEGYLEEAGDDGEEV